MDLVPTLHGYPIDPSVRRRRATTSTADRPGSWWRRLFRRVVDDQELAGAFVEGPFTYRVPR
jgi:hypothetical protein